MCVLCNGSGDVNIEYSWGVEFYPCNHPQCDFDRGKAIKELDETMNKIREEIYYRRNLI